jgi:hypothetical protein
MSLPNSSHQKCLQILSFGGQYHPGLEPLVSLIVRATFSTAECFCLSGEGHGPCFCHSGSLFQMAWQRGEHICPRGPQGPVSALPPPALPQPPSSTRPASFPTPSSLPGPQPVCQLQPQQLASSGLRANIYSSVVHPGPHRHTKDWCELASHPNRGQNLVFNQAPALGQRSS